VDDNLLGAPSEAETGCREPETSNLREDGHLGILGEEVLGRHITVRLSLRVVELRLELAVQLAKLELVSRRVGLGVALLVHRKLNTRLVIVADGIDAALLTEPCLAVLVGKCNDMLVEVSEHLVIPVNRAGRVIVALHAEIDRVVNTDSAELRLVILTESVRERNVLWGLEDELAAIVINIRLLSAAVEDTGVGNSNLGSREVGRGDDGVGHLGGLGLVP